MRSALSLIFIQLTYLSFSFAQSTKKIDPVKPIHIAELFFNASIKEQSRLFNGPLYQDYGPEVKGSANFQDSTSFSIGSVIYENFRFDSIPLTYDLHQDLVVTKTKAGNAFSLQGDKVTSFHLNGHNFQYLTAVDSTKSVIKPGFYDLLYDGKFRIYAKRTKSLEYVLEDKLIRYFFSPKTYYYIEKNQNYTAVSNEKSFLNYFLDKKPQLKKKLKEEQIKFRKHPEEAMLLLSNYYESLTK